MEIAEKTQTESRCQVVSMSGLHRARRFELSNELTKRAGPMASKQAEDAASRLKQDLMRDALGRMFGEDGKVPRAPGTPRVILSLANHGGSPGWSRAKVLQRQLFAAAGSNGLEMKFAFYGPDDAAGVRRCRITTRWITDADDMAAVMDRGRVQLRLLRQHSRRAGAGD